MTIWEYISGSLRIERGVVVELMVRDGLTMEERDWTADWIFSEVFWVKVTEGVVGVMVPSSDIVERGKVVVVTMNEL